ncbi:MAG: hypothetical protein R2706_09525 [Acidimicrobiales bacterium]
MGPRISDLDISATGPTTIAPGDTANVTLTVTNSGPSDTPSSSTEYTPPAGVSIDMANLPAGCVADSPALGSVTCDTGAIASGGSATLALPLTIGSGTLPGTVFTGGTASATTIDATDADGASVVPPDITTAAGVSNLTTVVSDPGPITPGQGALVDITTTNSGLSDAQTTSSSPTPCPRVSQSTWPTSPRLRCRLTGCRGSTTCDRGTIADGADTTFAVLPSSLPPPLLRQPSGPGRRRWRIVSGLGIDPDGDNVGVNLSTAAGEADLTIVAADPGPLLTGTSASVTLTATNAGPSDAPDSTVVYTPPTGVAIDVDNLPAEARTTHPRLGWSRVISG